MNPGTRQWSGRLLRALSLLTIAAAVFSSLPSDTWAITLIGNFRLHLAVVAALLAVPALKWLPLWNPVLLFLSAMLAALPVLQTHGAATGTPDLHNKTLTVVTYNINSRNERIAEAVAAFRTQSIDVLILQEYTESWQPFLAEMSDILPHTISEARNDNFGIAVLSRLPMETAAIQPIDAGNTPVAQVTFRQDEKPWTLFAVHLQWPVLPATFAQQKLQLAGLVTMVSGTENPLLVCGDFNMTPYTAVYRNLVAATGLHATPGLARFAGTWPAAAGIAGIPIDHCLAANGMRISGQQPGAAAGSDHRPVAYRVGIYATDH